MSGHVQGHSDSICVQARTKTQMTSSQSRLIEIELKTLEASVMLNTLTHENEKQQRCEIDFNDILFVPVLLK